MWLGFDWRRRRLRRGGGGGEREREVSGTWPFFLQDYRVVARNVTKIAAAILVSS